MADLIPALVRYLDASPTPFHAAAQSAALLHAAGFVQLQEHEPWSLSPGTRAFVVRGGTSIVAFVCGDKPAPESGFLVLGSHTDSPNLRIKPAADLIRHGYRQLGIEVYGGVLLSTWLDRDLSIAGRVHLQPERGAARAALVDFRRPLLRVPNLAIHLNRNVNSDGLVLNAQTHLAPILALADSPDSSLRELLASELNRSGTPCRGEDIVSWDLSLYDVQGASVSGARGEFVQSARLDNLASCFAATNALAGAEGPFAATRVIALYDHEEVGSRSAQGAASPFLREVLSRITHGSQSADSERFARAVARSFLISVDMAHAIHPNYADRHEPNHAPLIGGGPVIKSNVNQSYTTDGESAARFAGLCRKLEVPVQHFVVRSDMPCGSTIGPITAGQIGLAAVDIGSPLLSMHSIREMIGSADVGYLQRVLAGFFAEPVFEP